MKMSSRWIMLGCCWTVMTVGVSLQAATLGYWRFESGDVTGDSSGNGRTLTLTGSTGSAPTSYALPSSGAGSAFSNPIPQTGAANGYAIQGTGTNKLMQKYYTTTDTAAALSAMTVESYVNLSDNSTTSMKVIASQGANASDGSWAFGIAGYGSGQTAGNLLFQYRSLSGTWGSTGIDTINSGINLTVGHDYYVAAVANFTGVTTTSSITFYVQDLTLGTALQTYVKTGLGYGSLYDSTSTIALGADGVGNSGWTGTLDEMRISDSALSQSQLLIVPEPASVGMALMGLGMVWGAARRKRQ